MNEIYVALFLSTHIFSKKSYVYGVKSPKKREECFECKKKKLITGLFKHNLNAWNIFTKSEG